MNKEKIILYSNNCPCCKVLKTKLDEKKIEYETVSELSLILSKGIQTVPVLEIDGQMLNFKDAVKWVNERK